MRVFGTFSIVLLLVALAAPANAAPIAGDSFDYLPGALGGNAGGSGWSGAWSGNVSVLSGGSLASTYENGREMEY